MSRAAQSWKFRVLFCLGLFLSISCAAAPIVRLPAAHPDLIYCLALVWLIRRPHYVLTAAVVTGALITEILFFHAPGLWSAALLIICEYVRLNSERIRNLPFWLEWAAAACLFAAAQTACHLTLAIVFLPAGPVDAVIQHVGITALAYPAVALITNYVFRVTKPRAEDTPIFRGLAAYGDPR